MLRPSRLVVVLTAVLTMACAKDLQVFTYTPKLDLPQADKRLLLLSQSRWDPKIVSALERRGFVVAQPPTAERGSSALPSYGLTVYFGPQVDVCTVNDNVKYRSVQYAVSNTRQSQLLFMVEAGGTTGACAWHQEESSVFEQLAEALARTWAGQAAQD